MRTIGGTKKRKITDKIADYVRELRAAGLKNREIIFMVEREHDTTLGSSTVSDICNGYKAADRGTFREEDVDYIKSLQEDMLDTSKDIPRLEKLGVAYMLQKETSDVVMDHFKKAYIHLTESKMEEICKEVNGWIEEGTLQGEDEEWFGDIIQKNRKDDK